MPHVESYKINNGKTKRYKAVIEVGNDSERKRITKSFARKKDAQNWIAEKSTAKNKGYQLDKNTITVREQFDKWLRYKKTVVRPSTFDRYKYKVNGHLKPWFGDIPLKDLRPFHIADYFNQKRSGGRHDGKKGGLSNNTLKKHYVILNNMLQRAVKLKLIQDNPMDPIDSPKPEHYEAPTMTSEECKVLLKQTKDDLLMHTFISTLLLTGMRRSEALGLEWPNINFEEGFIEVKQSLVAVREGPLHENKVKNNTSRRKIFMHEKLTKTLKHFKTERNKLRLKFGEEYNDSNDLVFCHPDGQMYHPNTFIKKFNKHLKKSDLSSDYNLHTLRHTFATLNLKNNVPLKIVQQMLGHSSLSTTADIYTHPDIEMQKEPISKLEKLINY